jgi:ABC-type transporter MlaC component
MIEGGIRMRFSIQYQNTSGKWIVLDTLEGFSFVGSYRTEEDAMLAALALEERSRQQRPASNTSMVA